VRGALLLVLLAACDPIWGTRVSVRGPDNRPIEDATVAVACPDGLLWRQLSMSVRSKPDGTAYVGGGGSEFPVGCDVFVAKPGYRTHRIRYRDLCPDGHLDCRRYFEFELVLAPLSHESRESQ
jgi:hypothetical protein